MYLTAYGKREWLGGGVIAMAIAAAGIALGSRGNGFGGWVAALLATLCWLAMAAFFRVPKRNIPRETNILVSPADGVVKDIGVVTDHGIEPFEGMPLVRIGIFLSVFDVHVNRAPTDMEVVYRSYKPGRYLDARDPRCAKENESLVIAGYGHMGEERVALAVRQVSGAIARRIVCEPNPGDRIPRGGIYGMIKFGSRTELYFPANQKIKPAIQIGDKVRSGSTVIAKIEQVI